jgi:hypothetical protein
MALVSSSLGVYKYSPLDRDQPNAFRLFDLHPGKPSSPIECTLYESRRRTSPLPNWATPRRLQKALKSISSTTPYSALSYTWGDGQPTKTISMNGLPLKITRNLEEALRSLRDDSEGGHSRTLWVDAICINQIDLLERNHQVSQMQEIYADAEEVIVWLGPSTATSSIAIYFIEELYEAFEDLAKVPDGYDKDFETMDLKFKISDALPASAAARKKFEKRLQAVFELMLRPWWERVVRLIVFLSLSPDLCFCATLFIHRRISRQPTNIFHFHLRSF